MQSNSWQRNIRVSNTTTFRKLACLGDTLVTVAHCSESVLLYSTDLNGARRWLTPLRDFSALDLAAGDSHFFVAGTTVRSGRRGTVAVPTILEIARTGDLRKSHTLTSPAEPDGDLLMGISGIRVAHDGTLWLCGAVPSTIHGSRSPNETRTLPMVARVGPGGEINVCRENERTPGFYHVDCFTATDDGGCVVFGARESTRSEVFLRKYKHLGAGSQSSGKLTQEWERTWTLRDLVSLKEESWAFVTRAAETTLGGGCLVLGTAKQTTRGRAEKRSYLLEFSCSGDLIWLMPLEERRSSSGEFTVMTSVCDGHVFVGGHALGGDGPPQLLIQKIRLGEPQSHTTRGVVKPHVLWRQRLDTAHAIAGIVPARDGGVYCSATMWTSAGVATGCLLKFDSNGGLGRRAADADDRPTPTSDSEGAEASLEQKYAPFGGKIEYRDPSLATIDALKSLADGTVVTVGQKGATGYYEGIVVRGQMIHGTVVRDSSGTERFYTGMFSGNRFIPGTLTETNGRLGFIPGLWINEHFVPGLAATKSFGSPIDSGFVPGVFLPSRDANSLARWLPKLSNAKTAFYDPRQKQAFVPGKFQHGDFMPGDRRLDFLSTSKTACLLTRSSNSESWQSKIGYAPIGQVIGGLACAGLALTVTVVAAMVAPSAITAAGALALVADSSALGALLGGAAGAVMDMQEALKPHETSDPVTSSTISVVKDTEKTVVNVHLVLRPGDSASVHATPEGVSLDVKAQPISDSGVGPTYGLGFMPEPCVETIENGAVKTTCGGEVFMIQPFEVSPPGIGTAGGETGTPTEGPDGPNTEGDELASVPPALLQLIVRYMPEKETFSAPIEDVAFFAPDNFNGSSNAWQEIVDPGTIDSGGPLKNEGSTSTFVLPDPGTIDHAHGSGGALHPRGTFGRSDSTVEIVLPRGEVVRVPRDVEVERLIQVLAVLTPRQTGSSRPE